MGITTPLLPVVSMPLGTQEVRPIDMAAAIASIPADGMFNPPYYVDRVLDRNGKEIFAHRANPRRAESPASARLATDVLEKNVQGGTGTRARIPGQHAAGKTGTAQNSGDGWFVGFTPYLATAVWMGSPDDRLEVRLGGRGITGGSYPAEIWGRYMRAWHEGLPEADYPPPPTTRFGRYLRLDSKIDARAGSSSTSTTRRRRSSSSGTTSTTISRSTPTTESPDTTEPSQPTTPTTVPTPTTSPGKPDKPVPPVPSGDG
jgi:membrane peptidoglycan carboxypeptidase